MTDTSRVFSALLRYWRSRRGLSQLDLALAAGVSARHVSFLETGRSQPSPGMVLRLADTLDVPLREQNVMLREAGHPAAYDEPRLGDLGAGVQRALDVMLRHHEPFPMMVLDRAYDVLRLNTSAEALVRACLGEIPAQWNVIRAFFDSEAVRPFVQDWEATARLAIARLHRESLRAPHDDRLRDLLDEVLRAPGVPEAWRTPDLSRGTEGTYLLRLGVAGQALTFITTLTVFQAPQNVTLEEIQIESYLPADEATERACAELTGHAPPGL